MTKTFQKIVNGNTYELTRIYKPDGSYDYSCQLIQSRQHNYSMAYQLPEEDLSDLMSMGMVDSLDEE
jgi:hypothetical protein